MKHLYLAIMIGAASAQVWAETLLVPEEYATITEALSNTYSSDIIIVSPGVYAETGNTSVTLKDKMIKIRSTDPGNPETVARTVLECLYTYEMYSGFVLDSNCTLILEGFTIRNGLSETGGVINCQNSTAILRSCVFENCIARKGGTIYAVNSILKLEDCQIIGSMSTEAGGNLWCMNSQVDLQGCLIKDGYSENRGGAVCAENSNLIISNSQLDKNISRWDGGGLWARNCQLSINASQITGNEILVGNASGGGIYVEYSSSFKGKTYIRNSAIKNNIAQYFGGGIMCRDLIMSRCEITGNISDFQGGGLYVDGTAEITSSIIAGNFSHRGAGIEHHGLDIVFENCTVADNRGEDGLYIDRWKYIRNCIVWGNNRFDISGGCGGPTALYCDSGYLPYYGKSNIVEDPLFVRPGQWQGDVYIEGDYHLLPESPCINRGDPNMAAKPGETDFDGNPRIRLGRIDMGAYEAGSNEMDFDENGIVNLEDFSMTAQGWIWQGKWR